MKKLLLYLTLLFSTSTIPAIEIPGSAALADAILERFDKNENGILDAAEWQAGVEEGFGQLDQDNSRTIDAAEKKDLDALIGDEVGEVKAKLIAPIITSALRSFDSDEDGAVTRKEFDDAASDLFKKLDANSDSEITRKELKQLPLKLL